MIKRPFTFPLPNDGLLYPGWWFDVFLDGEKIGRGVVDRMTDEGLIGSIEFFGIAPSKNINLTVSHLRPPNGKD